MKRQFKVKEMNAMRDENRRLSAVDAAREQELYQAARKAELLEKDCTLMEDYVRMQDAFHAGNVERLSATKRRLRRERRETAKWKRTAIAGAVLMAVTVMIMALASFAFGTTAAAEERMDPSPETDENALIEAALFESGYFRSDIPLDGDTQAELHAACDEFGVQYELALAVIHQETNYQNITGDNGKSIGYMQVQPRWCQARMAELGIRDLSIPYDNFRTGCSILAEAIEHYGLVGGLTAYNSGSPGTSAYASEVLAYMGTLEAA